MRPRDCQFYQNANIRNSQQEPDRFFEFANPTNQVLVERENLEINIRSQCFKYLNDPSQDILSLHAYPIIKPVFVKYTTPLASSAAVKRLFNYSRMILCPNRRSLEDATFEKLTLLKVNKHY